jgi:hypothetical protein
VATYEEEFPPEHGPPGVYPGMGEKIFNAEKPQITVTLSYASFIVLWEVIEAEAKLKYPTKNVYKHIRALLQAVEELRKEFDVAWDAGLIPKDFVRDRRTKLAHKAPSPGKGKKVVKRPK